MSEVRIPLSPTQYYHIFNHAVGDDLFFRDDSDYYFFLKKVNEYVLPVTDFLAYCLQPNHFHFVVRIKTRDEVSNFLKLKLGIERFAKLHSQEGFIEDQLSRIYSNLFSSYAKYYNRSYSRMGTLFKRAFMRNSIETMEYLHAVIGYVHLNPVHHDIAAKPDDWTFSSYKSIVNRKSSLVKHEEVMDLYGGIDNFLVFHQSPDQ